MRKLLIGLVSMLLVAAFIAPTFAQDGTIADVAAENTDFQTLLTAVGLADPAVAAALADPDAELTLFAPTNDAFTVTLQELGLSVVDVAGNPEAVTQILLYHVVEGVVMAEDVVGLDGEEVETLQGESVSISVDGDTVMVNGATVLETDIEASNGVIHSIDRVLVPEAVLMALAGGAEAPAVEIDETLGTDENPIVLLFIPSENSQEVQAGADDLASALEEITGLEIEASVSTNYAAAIEALCSQEAEIAALNTFGYILASQRNCATVGVVSTRFGSAYYAGQIITQADSGIESYADLAGTTFCRPDELSTSGWIIPSIALRANGVDLDSLDIIDAGGHDGVVQAVYSGECDAGATFEDARTQVEADLEDVMEKVVVIDVSAPIPNDTLSFGNHLAPETQQAIVDALLEIAGDEEKLALLGAVYNWGGLIEAEDAFFDDFREQLDAAGVDIEDLN